MDEQQQPQPAATANPPAEDYAGRRDLDDLRQAYRASGQEAQRLAQENQLLRQQQAANPPRPEVPQREVDPYSELEAMGVPRTSLQSAIQREAAQFFAPVVRQLEGQAQARNHMLANYGKDYVTFEQDVAQHIQSDPQMQQRYQALFSTDPVAAVEYAYLKFGETQRRAAPQPEQQDRAERRSQQAQAAIPSGRNGEARQAPSNRDNVQRAFEAYQKNPNRTTAEAFAKARFKEAIPDSFLYGNQLF